MVYNLLQWMCFFYVYSFLGWCIESIIVSVKRHRLINRGFLKIPMLPLYGSGAVLLLILILPYKYNILYVYIGGLVSATILEYIVGAVMENIFKMKYWDYSKDIFNYKGRICLVSSLFWGVLCVLLVEVVHDYICSIVNLISTNILEIILSVMSIIFIIDTFISIRNAIDLQKVLERVTLLRNQIESAYDDIYMLLENAALEFDSHKNREELSLFVYNTKQKLIELKEKVEKLKEGRRKEILNISLGKLRLINGNPTASSVKFNDSLKEIRDKIYNNYEEHIDKIMKRLSLFQKKIEDIIRGNK